MHLVGAADSLSRARVFAAAPLTTLVALILWVLIIWLRAGIVYSHSHQLDHRPAGLSQALAAAWNVTGRLVLLDGLGLVVVAGWSIGLLKLIRRLDGLTLAPTAQTAVGIGICLTMTLVLLILVVWYSLARQITILGSSSFGGTLRAAGGLARRLLGAAMALAIWLTVLAAGLVLLAGVILVSPHWLAVTHTEAYLATAVVLIVGLHYLSTLTLISWLTAYRQLVHSRGSHHLAAYLGRKPQPVHRLVITVSLVWWLLVAVAASYLLWRAHYDPKQLLDHLRALRHN